MRVPCMVAFVCVALSGFVNRSFAAEPAEILRSLEDAKAAYKGGTDSSRAALLTAFDEVTKSIAQSGDLDGVKAVRAERTAFEEKGTLPTSQRMRAASNEYQRSIRQSAATMSKGYEDTIKELTKLLAIEQAEKVQAEFKEFEARKGAAPTATARISGAAEPSERLIGRFDVRADGDWQASVPVRSGQVLRLRAEGEWCMNTRRRNLYTYGPDGLRKDGTAEEHGICALLMARVGPRVLLVGKGSEISIDRDGVLELRSNDFNLPDNDGTMSVSIYVRDGGKPATNPIDEFKRSISGSRWNWGDGVLLLKPDGYVTHPLWDSMGLVTKWEVVDRRTVVFIITGGRNVNRLAVLEFAEDMDSFSGRDFLSGEQRLTPKKRVE